VAFISILGFLGRYFWFFDLFSNFRYQYTVALFFSGVTSLLLKQWRLFIFCILFGFLNVIQVSAYLNNNDAVRAGGIFLDLLFLNVNTGLGNPKEVVDLVDESSPDFVALVEINSNWINALSDLRERYPFQKVIPQEDNFGLSLYSRYFNC